jgi:hypothetical protein
MARIRLKKLWPVALSISAASEAIQTRRKYLADAVEAGSLAAHVIDNQTRILVADLVEFVRWHPLPKLKKGVRHG